MDSEPAILATSPSYRLDSSPLGDDLTEMGRDYGDYQDRPPQFDDRLRVSVDTASPPTSRSFRRVIISPLMEELEQEESEEVFTKFMQAINLRGKYVYLPHDPHGLNKFDALTDPLLSPSSSSVSLDTSPIPPPAPGGKATYRDSIGGLEDLYGHPLPSKPSFDPVIPGPSQHVFKFVDGVAHIYQKAEDAESGKPALFAPVADLSQYYKDLNELLGIMSDGPCKTQSYKRLRVLEAKFDLHRILNEEKEKAEQKAVRHRDFYNVYKVDTHIHLSSAMNQKHLLKFIKRKLREHPTEIVIFRDGKNLTLKQVFESLKLQAHDLSVDSLDVHADTRTFHRFDRFNLKYNPVGESRLREIFLKTDNMIQGKYMAEIVAELIQTLEESKYQCVEWRISIYGRSKSEWDKLAAWIVDNNLISHQVRWLVQLPRLYHVYKASKQMSNFQEMVDNIFLPLFEVSRDPSTHPKLHQFLRYCVGFDCVDDESKPEPRILRKYPSPVEWSFDKNPPYSYYCYYIYSNLYVLNKFRESKGFCTFEFRPHSGEAGDVDHLGTAFLLSHGIAHGIMLRKTPVLQYLFYLTQLGIYMSPLSNNSLFLDYSRNPFPSFFGRGLNVSLSTDDPLQFHYTKEPIIEEYSIAAQVWKLSTTDICEIAFNSALHSGFEPDLKRQWLGHKYHLPGAQGNDITKTNVPAIRRMYRHETHMQELANMFSLLKDKSDLDIIWLVNQLSYADNKETRKEVSKWRYKQDTLKFQRSTLAHAISHHSAALEPSTPVDVPRADSMLHGGLKSK